MRVEELTALYQKYSNEGNKKAASKVFEELYHVMPYKQRVRLRQKAIDRGLIPEYHDIYAESLGGYSLSDIASNAGVSDAEVESAVSRYNTLPPQFGVIHTV